MIFAMKQEETKKITSTKELANYILETVNNPKGLSDEEKAKKEAKILSKMKAGKKLTEEEMQYLRKNNPMMYAHAMRVQLMIKSVEEQLKHAKSKEEANQIVSGMVTGLSKDDPDKEYIVAAMSRISTEMHQSPTYSRLPNTIEDAKKAREQKSGIQLADANEEDEEEFDPMGWSPLQDVIDSMPTFEAGA